MKQEQPNHYGLHIDGRWCPAQIGGQREVPAPATEEDSRRAGRRPQCGAGRGGTKESGIDREGGVLGIKDYLEAKFIKMRI